ncbi:MAG TPA: FHA domain-containing protein [Sediminispirochaeta sp.]|nr:FHA domain-containing protein [Sediminispirochaeta sp.]
MSAREWYLQGQLPDKSPWIVPIYKRRFSIGRGTDRDLILSTAGVSRRHACVYRDGNDLYIEDSDSRNGTFLNGARIEGRRLLHHGDILQIGGYEFSICYQEPGEAGDQTIVEYRRDPKSAFARTYGLSVREQDVLYLLLRGKTSPEIGEKLYISSGTAKLHIQNIYKKTGCHSRMELVALYRGPIR